MGPATSAVVDDSGPEQQSHDPPEAGSEVSHGASDRKIMPPLKSALKSGASRAKRHADRGTAWTMHTDGIGEESKKDDEEDFHTDVNVAPSKERGTTQNEIRDIRSRSSNYAESHLEEPGVHVSPGSLAFSVVYPASESDASLQPSEYVDISYPTEVNLEPDDIGTSDIASYTDFDISTPSARRSHGNLSESGDYTEDFLKKGSSLKPRLQAVSSNGGVGMNGSSKRSFRRRLLGISSPSSVVSS